jgi:hypothetical protein
MRKPASNGTQCISATSGYNDFLALYPFSSSWPKDPLRMNAHEEIGRARVMGRPTS